MSIYGGRHVKLLEHEAGECVGNWRLVGSGDDRAIRCDTCAKEYGAEPENRLAAIDENYAGIYLRRLTAEGFAQLEAERGAREDDAA